MIDKNILFSNKSKKNPKSLTEFLPKMHNYFQPAIFFFFFGQRKAKNFLLCLKNEKNPLKNYVPQIPILKMQGFV